MSSPNAHGLTSRQSSLVVVAIVSIIAPTVAVGLRLLSRRLVRASLWWDDYLAILALVSGLDHSPHSRSASILTQATAIRT